jgi:GTP-binding protein HflX
VRDIAHEETDADAGDVRRVLEELGIDPNDARRLLEVWNKIDLLPEEERRRSATVAARMPPERRPVLVSAATGEGLDGLLKAIERRVTEGRATFAVRLDPAEGQALNWLYEEAEVLDRRTDEDGSTIVVARVAPEKEPRLLNRFPSARRTS